MHPHSDERLRPAGRLSGRAAVSRAVRLLAIGFVALVVFDFGGEGTRESLIADHREAHARTLSNCGVKKACIRKSLANARSAGSRTAIAASPSLPPEPLRKWSEAQYDQVTVWIAPGEGVPLWRGVFRDKVRDAFHDWTSAGAPVHFVFVADSLHADVRVTWSDSLPESRAGQATRFADRRGWIRGAIIELSTRNIGGGAQDSTTIHAVALHEVGHLLGLEHSDDERDIMAPWVKSSALTARDRSAMRSLYGVAVD
ncbi:MAG: matrixin family metalloprotease [bacterium]